jgi:hypothetical protein
MLWNWESHFGANRFNGFVRGVFEGEAASVHQDLEGPRIHGYVFWDQNACIVFDAYSPISSTGIDKTKDLSIICLHIIFLIFLIHHTNRPWLKLEVIHATK